jgi:hypothetical protein
MAIKNTIKLQIVFFLYFLLKPNNLYYASFVESVLLQTTILKNYINIVNANKHTQITSPIFEHCQPISHCLMSARTPSSNNNNKFSSTLYANT